MLNQPRFRPPSIARSFFSNEAAGGLTLMCVAALALLIANSPLAPVYFDVLHRYVFGLSVLHWINDALMAVFFLLVGLEIKRELMDGQLATWSRRALPGIAALGGMIVPAVIFVAINWNEPLNLRGWAIPSATDIAFALGVFALLGPRVPVSLKIFLTALAILDDLGAVAIIALFYTAELSPLMLGLAAATLLALAALNRSGVKHLAPYLILGSALWFFMLQSGVHATIAGVALALTIPLKVSSGDSPESPLHRLEHALSPWVAFLIVPIFGFANAGVSFAGVTPAALLDPVPLGIALGLFVGKQVGVFGFAWLAIRLDLADMPRRASWAQLYGVAVLCGIGFTMSLFVGLLAYPGSALLQDQTKIGVLLGSTLAGIVGWLVLRVAKAKLPKAS
ncbi:MAG: Na+/H+ antiporter NhaA [Mesorhizobium sp.]|uniref:Na+/H+ antiporter NhaA n=1 Tax=Mesorhizobium sp. TaxID=1871066 RepID=UPI000FEA3D86|nr:Na+/H+ antiporter NhaA [Mesorhizobium sp.]RWD47229.1 MAG: Na+/H+ antiporter NhaA [Mesorhizobium sp.]RWE61647.1 MAG: Na+/H+ antiporter NhaA [Mesorhizobium sp.]RWF13377.1 MAG: Na+/H+ antiporter NhaA [Mesorhizobium sp.]RWF22822.1 MAG: Na+/H+ antiporter NhaA [Mesorhizobium sp.]TIY06682.1 MAG: Na+/H+ antiporter NhaA [Mesorhizobium sp.]